METTKENATHTPGEWTASKDIDGEPERWAIASSFEGKNWMLATIENGAPGDTLETEGANARLFAAAKDLFASVHRFLECHQAAMPADSYTEKRKPCQCGACNEGRAAIAKATP